MIEISLNLKPIPVPVAYQPIYKIAMLLAILKFGTKGKNGATLLRIHIYLWALRSSENMKVLREISTKQRNSILPWAFEPALNRIITFGVINGYCERVVTNGNLQIKITSAGENFLIAVMEQGIFVDDINNIQEVGVIPQKGLEQANDSWAIK